jgi:hypothetical protein
MFRLLRLPRLYRLTKIVKLSKGGSNSFISKFFDSLGITIGVKKILVILSNMLILSHLAACFYYFTARLSDYDDETWVSRLELNNSGYFMKYITSLYWSI